MGKFRQLGKVLMLGALAHSRWELEMSKEVKWVNSDSWVRF
jgi:hypothetical protein